MLTIVVSGSERYDPEIDEFIPPTKDVVLVLEHSLVSVAKWESKWKKVYLSKDPKTNQQLRDYVKCMTITQNVPDEVYRRLTVAQYKQVDDYINESRTATFLRERPNKGPKRPEAMTSDLIYYWMTQLNIPFTCEKWHLSRLLMLIRVAEHKGKTPKPMKREDIIKRNRELNASRRQKTGSSG